MQKAVIVLLVAATSALTCFECQDKPKCPKLPCQGDNRQVFGQCACCPKCGKKVGQTCSETDPCNTNLKCYALNFNPFLPSSFKGICVNAVELTKIPPKPVCFDDFFIRQ